MAKPVKKKLKVAGRNMVDSTRRHEADMGGRNPLTAHALVPVGCVIGKDLLKALKKRSEDFISPSTFKPYGVTALTRIIVQNSIDLLDKTFVMDVLSYLDNREDNMPGRAPVAEEPTRISLLMPKELVDRVNDKVEEFNNPLIGTSTIIRYLIEKGLQKAKTRDFYKWIPPKHKDLMIDGQHTISSLQARYQKSKHS